MHLYSRGDGYKIWSTAVHWKTDVLQIHKLVIGAHMNLEQDPAPLENPPGKHHTLQVLYVVVILLYINAILTYYGDFF